MRSKLILSLLVLGVILVGANQVGKGSSPLRRETSTPAKPEQEPIRVGQNVQESKLVYRVDPVYPAEAKAAGISGVVILQITVNENGEVWDVKVLRGHPLLDDAALDAVRQWRYSPTLLNGQPVPVIATVTVIFSLSEHGGALSLVMDKSGNLRERRSGLEGQALMDKVRAEGGLILVAPHPGAPFRTVEDSLRALERVGARKIQILGPYAFHQGRLFYTVRQGMTVGLGALQAPEIALDSYRLAAMARTSGMLESIPQVQGARRLLLYRLFLNEVGEIVSIQRLSGPPIPEVEAELARTRVMAPGRLGPDPVPMAIDVKITID